jgi:Calcineurin-like phosphoesterase
MNARRSRSTVLPTTGRTTRARLAVLGVGATALGLALLAVPASPVGGSTANAARSVDTTPLATFVSTSGITHADVADTSVLRAGHGWDPGDPNGITDEWRGSIDTAWDQIASASPDAVFITGDMVQGFWGVDDDHTGVFGPVDTFTHRKAAVVRAGLTYEGAVRDAWTRHGLTVYPGMGDHEIGDLNHVGYTPASAFKARALSAWMSAWTQTYGHPPYYHVALAGSVELWTLQPFRKNADGSVSATIGGAQLQWLARSLDRSTAQWKIVQCEIPPYTSPGFLGRSTSGTHLHNAKQVYDVLAQHGADLLLSAEFHDVDALQRQHLPEIVHGAALTGGNLNYLTIDVYPDVLQIQVSRMAQGIVDNSQLLWEPSNRRRPPWKVTMSPGATVTGHMTVTHNGVTAADGELVLR